MLNEENMKFSSCLLHNTPVTHLAALTQLKLADYNFGDGVDMLIGAELTTPRS